MFLLSFSRVIKFSLQDIGRNVWLSVVTITILTLSLFSVNLLLTVKVIGDATFNLIKEKVDVSLYLKTNTEEAKILDLKNRISQMDNVKDVVYISQSEALENFKKNQQYNPEILEALRELGKNPLTPSLIIRPKNVNEYNVLTESLNKFDDEIIESRNFDDHKAMLDKINFITSKVTRGGMLVSLIFIFTTILVVYYAIRVAIYTHRREIAIMKLVGASNWFIRSPYLISSLLYTFLGVVIIVLIYYPFLSLLQPYLEAFFIGYDINIVAYFNQNFFQIFGTQFVVAALINVVASLIAVGKYSKV